MKRERIIKLLLVGVILFFVVRFGIIPMLSGSAFKEYLGRITADKYNFSENEYAVIVVGSEPEGIAAAVSSARTGLKTLLITEDSDLGSYIKRSMIAEIKPDEGIIGGKKENLNRGFYKELFGSLRLGFTAEDYLSSVENLTKQIKNLAILYNCRLTDVVLEGSLLRHIRVNVDGQERVLSAAAYVDATQFGDLLDLCQVPYTTGSADLNLPDTYMPLAFNFMVSGVKWDDMRQIQKTSDFIHQFRQVLMAYQPFYKRTKIESPTFIEQSEDKLIISAIRQWGVNVNDPEDVKQAYADAMDEAILLTAYLKNVLVPFAECTFEAAADELFIPEYRHYAGRYTLTVADILENRDFADKIVLASAPVDAGKFVGNGLSYIITDPNVYAIPLGCIIPVNVDNVLMPGAKASFKSLAATSAGHIPIRITMGESAGLTAAWSFLNNRTPADILSMTGEELDTFKSYLQRGGVFLKDISEKLMDASTGQPLENAWAYPYIRELAEYGLLAGGEGNDFRLDSESSCDVMSVLLKNAIVKIAPDAYNFNVAGMLEAYETSDRLTGEKAASMILDALGVSYTPGEAFNVLSGLELYRKVPEGKLTQNGGVTMDVVYCLAVETARLMK
ncbi:FAD-dependent oxidoreductase [Thermoclostridium caenicola]|uniref:FAD dependent oxidoreductase n=1 Tax=Thermoclostridium caenicola TaxID=659425 RepID=A0A1M6GDH4_9FIRM|nr:FAD-dependent oxidoreductase [Thermoclostridium caenicola]SHJ07949.1 FAD dependent oxidoreductase [Thermoclostridium caenicola]